MNKYKTFLIALIIVFIGAFAMAFVACSGTDGADGTNGTNGTDGKDGTTLTSITPAYDADGETVLSYTLVFSDGTTFTVYNGQDGADGKDGNDGADGTTLTGVTPNYAADGVTVLSYTIEFSDGKTFTVYNGTTGEKGDTGEEGTGIASVEKTDTDGLTDTYTITLTNGDTYTFTVTNGKSAYQLYKETYGYTGTEAEWLYDLVNGNLSYKAEYTVTFNYNDGATSNSTVTVTEGNTVARPEDPVRDGYTFDGWYCSGEKWSFIGYVVTDNITLTAMWTENEKVTSGLQYTINSNYLSYTVSGYTGDDTEVYIPSTYNGLVVSQIGANAFYGNTAITYVELAETITVIGDYAFNGCTALGNIKLSVALVEIGSYAFYGCKNLASITISDGVTSIGTYAFYNCSSLVSVNISTNSNLTSIPDYAFLFCSALTSITIPDRITEIGVGAFKNCSSLETVNISGNSKLTSISERAFAFCSALTSITIPNGVTEIGYDTFYDCSSLASITIPNSVTRIGEWAFLYCSSLKTVNFGRDCSLTTIGRSAFSYCTALTSITIPSTVTSIDARAFYNCKSLTTVYTTNTSYGYSNVLTVDNDDGANDYFVNAEVYYYSSTRPDVSGNSYNGNYWYYGDLYTPAIYDASTPAYEMSADGTYYTFMGFNCTSSYYEVPSSYNGLPVTAIGSNAFMSNDVLTEVTIPDCITSINGKAFGWISSLTTVNISKNSKLTTIGSGAFSFTAIERIYIPDSVTYIGSNAFYKCESLTKVELGKNSRLETIDTYAFYNCTALTYIIIPASVTSVVVYAFNVCHSLTTIYYGGNSNSYSNISIDSPNGNFLYATVYYYSETQPTDSGNYWHYVNYYEPAIWGTATDGLEYTISEGGAYYTVTGYTGTATDVYIPKTYDSLPVTAIGDSAFYENTAITSIYIPASVTSIGTYAFYGCTSLAAVYIDNDSGLQTIGERAFYGCSILTSIYIPTTVTEIGNSAFYNCNALSKVYYNGSESEWATISFGSGSASPMYHGATLYLTGMSAVNIVIEDVTKINDCAFYGCTSIKSVTIKSGVTTIGEYAFRNCTSLEIIVLSTSVESIGKHAFNGCTALTSVYYAGTEWQWSLITIGGSNEYLTAAEITYNYEW